MVAAQTVDEVGDIPDLQPLIVVIMTIEHCVRAPFFEGPLHPGGGAMRPAGVGCAMKSDQVPFGVGAGQLVLQPLSLPRIAGMAVRLTLCIEDEEVDGPPDEIVVALVV